MYGKQRASRRAEPGGLPKEGGPPRRGGPGGAEVGRCICAGSMVQYTGKRGITMEYGTVEKARFLARPNRFIARVELHGKVETVHVKNTGRCRELLVPGATVYLAEGKNPTRKTRYDLIAVEKGSLLINMDSQAPNAAAKEALPRLIPGLTLLRPETVYGDSRFDFYAEAGEARGFIEVKGVTLEEDGVARFPDAPTQRGEKHLRELMRAVREGYRAMALFVVQMKGVTRFEPNAATDPAFAAALREAAANGVQVLAVDCLVTPNSMALDREVPVRL